MGKPLPSSKSAGNLVARERLFFFFLEILDIVLISPSWGNSMHNTVGFGEGQYIFLKDSIYRQYIFP